MSAAVLAAVMAGSATLAAQTAAPTTQKNFLPNGDTLVVDSIGFNDRTWLDQVGHPHTEQLHFIER